LRNVTLALGPIWQMQLLRTRLAEHGVPSFLADENLKTLDPVATGALSFDVRLEVPEALLDAARAALAEAHAEQEELRGVPWQHLAEAEDRE